MSTLRYLSLFSGMEAAHLACSPLGWECAAVAEIEPAVCQLLAHRLPHVPNLGSVTDVTDEHIAALGPMDVVIGGSPCQDLSVAGKHAGLAGARSSLFHEQLRIFNAAQHFCGARWLVWENVPGAFSSNAGRDFAVVVGAMAGADLVAPAGGWGSEGMAVGANGLVEWCVLDAQWFGVAQRRRRVFAVLDTGDWANRAPVLLERDGLRGDSAPRRETRKDVAPTISARTSGGGGLGTDFECDGGLIPDIARCITTGERYRPGLIPDIARCITTGEPYRLDSEICTIIPVTAHTLRADGFDASEDGTGRGTPLIPVAFSCKDHAADAGEISPTLRAMGHGASHANAGGQVAVAFGWQNLSDQGDSVSEHVSPTLDKSKTPAVGLGMAVRRLTPRECERLQGAPDNWTLVPNKHGKPMADGPRYKMLGNSFAVPCIAWIGRQIQRAHEATVQLEDAA